MSTRSGSISYGGMSVIDRLKLRTIAISKDHSAKNAVQYDLVTGDLIYCMPNKTAAGEPFFQFMLGQKHDPMLGCLYWMEEYSSDARGIDDKVNAPLMTLQEFEEIVKQFAQHIDIKVEKFYEDEGWLFAVVA